MPATLAVQLVVNVNQPDFVQVLTGKRVDLESDFDFSLRVLLGRMFKWIKQHLHIKAAFGTLENAVKIHVWMAIAVYILVAIDKKGIKSDASFFIFEVDGE